MWLVDSRLRKEFEEFRELTGKTPGQVGVLLMQVAGLHRRVTALESYVLAQDVKGTPSGLVGDGGVSNWGDEDLADLEDASELLRRKTVLKLKEDAAG